MSTPLPKILIYSDGACSGNPGPGGWGAILISGDHRKEISGGEALTTNNRMELLAAISALEALKKRSDVELWTDSAYVRNGITAWIHGWEKVASDCQAVRPDVWRWRGCSSRMPGFG